MSKILKSPNRNQKKPGAFFVGVLLFSFILEIFSTLLTLHCLKCLFYVNNHRNKVLSVIIVEKGSKLNMTSENIIKKTLCCFGFQVGDINISENFNKIDKFK